MAHYNFIYSFEKNITSINSLGVSVILFKIKGMELVEAVQQPEELRFIQYLLVSPANKCCYLTWKCNITN
jgi:hypothetical protein